MKLTISKIKEIIKESLTEGQINLLLREETDEIKDLRERCKTEPIACFKLGTKYYNGEDVEKDAKTALDFFIKGCGKWKEVPVEEGSNRKKLVFERNQMDYADDRVDDSCHNAALMYEYGEGAAWNDARAKFYHAQACSLEKLTSCKRLRKLEAGKGIPREETDEPSMQDKVEAWLKGEKPTKVKGRCPDKPCPEGQICIEEGGGLKCVDGKDFCDLDPNRRNAASGRFMNISFADADFREVISFIDCEAGVPIGVLDAWEGASFPKVDVHLKCASGDEAIKWVLDKYNIKYTYSAETEGIYIIGADNWKPSTNVRVRKLRDVMAAMDPPPERAFACTEYRVSPFEKEEEPLDRRDLPRIVVPVGKENENLGPWKGVYPNPGDIGTGLLPGQAAPPHHWKIPGDMSWWEDDPLPKMTVGLSCRHLPCGSPPSYVLLYCLSHYHPNTVEMQRNIDAISKKLQGKLPRKKQNLMPCRGQALPGGNEPLCDYGEEEYGYEYITKILQHAGYGVPAGSWPAAGKNRRRRSGIHDWPTKPIPMEKWKYYGPRPCPWEKQTRLKINPRTKQKRRAPAQVAQQKKPSDTRKGIPPANPNANYVISFLVKPGYGFYQILRDMGLLKGRTRKQRRALIKKLRKAFEGRMITTKDIVHLDVEGNLTVEKPHGCVLKRPLEKNSQGWYICADKQPVRENIDFSSFPEYQNFFENWKKHLNKE